MKKHQGVGSFNRFGTQLSFDVFRSHGLAVGRVPSVDVAIASSFGRRSVAQSCSGRSGFGL